MKGHEHDVLTSQIALNTSTGRKKNRSHFFCVLKDPICRMVFSKVVVTLALLALLFLVGTKRTNHTTSPMNRDFPLKEQLDAVRFSFNHLCCVLSSSILKTL
jgi:hypothetical protein